MSVEAAQPHLEDVCQGIDVAVCELADLSEHLCELLAERSPLPEVTTMHRPPASRPPWDQQTANTYMAIHASARQLEAELRHLVMGGYWRRLGGSDKATRKALVMIAHYCRDERVPEGDVRAVARHLGDLIRAAQSCPAIDTAPAPAATLRQACPYCQTGALTAAVDGSTEIYCANQACVDPVSGVRPRWGKRDWPFLLGRLTRG